MLRSWSGPDVIGLPTGWDFTWCPQCVGRRPPQEPRWAGGGASMGASIGTTGPLNALCKRLSSSSPPLCASTASGRPVPCRASGRSGSPASFAALGQGQQSEQRDTCPLPLLPPGGGGAQVSALRARTDLWIAPSALLARTDLHRCLPCVQGLTCGSPRPPSKSRAVMPPWCAAEQASMLGAPANSGPAGCSVQSG